MEDGYYTRWSGGSHGDCWYAKCAFDNSNYKTFIDRICYAAESIAKSYAFFITSSYTVCNWLGFPNVYWISFAGGNSDRHSSTERNRLHGSTEFGSVSDTETDPDPDSNTDTRPNTNTQCNC
jgi:hypothetical protein